MRLIVLGTIIAVVLIGVALMITQGISQTKNDNLSANNVTIIDGKQIIEIKAKGGYSPRTSIAKAGISTVLRFDTKGTFDCSASVRIPSMNIGKILPQTGITDIDLGIQNAGTLQGSCGMGMYPFAIEFQALPS